ncbi:MAG: 50S ribosomal protein L25 [Chloroflexi bacterium]|nr:50S ribosomal protein L25 [Chloroflexota bacterium]
MDTISLDVSPRDITRKKVRALRKTGVIPLHLYGNGVPSQTLQADSSTVSKVVNHVGQNIPLYLKQEGNKQQDLVFVREVQHHPITNRILHVDFFRVDVTHTVRGDVPVVLFGEAPAVRTHHGILMQTLHELSVECLPMEMPERIEIDISGLEELDNGIRVSDYIPASGVTILTDPDELIVRIGAPRVVEEEVARPAEVTTEEAAVTEESD